MFRPLLRLALAASAIVPLSAAEPIKAEHVVLVVWDGMRPDFITPETTPTASALAKGGTFFNHNHSVYITSTEVNGTAIATGCYPAQSGILANREYRPSIDPLKSFGTENENVMRAVDAATNGEYLRVSTIAELVQQGGGRSAIACTKPVGLLLDRSPIKKNGSAILFAGQTYPRDLLQQIVGKSGEFPDFPPPGVVAPNTAQNAWTTAALVDEMWKDGVPKFSTLWLGDPDFTQHLTQPGSPAALAAIRNSDSNLATLLGALEAKGVREKTDVFLVSDHGFSTVDRTIDFAALCKAAGFKVVREYKTPPQPGEVLLIILGGSCQLYVPGHDAELIRRLVDFLEASDFSGPIFTREELPGTFTLHDARIDSPDSADIVFSFRWRAEKNQWGTPGTFVAEGRRPGFGTHASLSPFDIHNTLLAAGPDIRAGFVDELPTANVDVAPTILHILGIEPPEARGGRVLREALVGEQAPLPQPETIVREAKTATWRQYLKMTHLGDSVYLDEGNAVNLPAEK